MMDSLNFLKDLIFFINFQDPTLRSHHNKFFIFTYQEIPNIFKLFNDLNGIVALILSSFVYDNWSWYSMFYDHHVSRSMKFYIKRLCLKIEILERFKAITWIFVNCYSLLFSQSKDENLSIIRYIYIFTLGWKAFSDWPMNLWSLSTILKKRKQENHKYWCF